MAYNKTNWTDHIVEFPNRFQETTNPDGTVTLNHEPGEVIQEGTPLSAEKLNNIETGVQEAVDGIIVLEDSTTSTSTTKAATPNSVRQVAEYLETHQGENEANAHNAGNISYNNSTTGMTATNVQQAINEVFQFGNNVKSDMVAALLAVDPELPITINSSWNEIELATAQIRVGIRSAKGTTMSSATVMYTYYLDNSDAVNGSTVIVPLDFKAKTIILTARLGSIVSQTIFMTNETINGKTEIIKRARYNNASYAYDTQHTSGGLAYVNETGFRLPISYANASVYYEAYGE